MIQSGSNTDATDKHDGRDTVWSLGRSTMYYLCYFTADYLRCVEFIIMSGYLNLYILASAWEIAMFFVGFADLSILCIHEFIKSCMIYICIGFQSSTWPVFPKKHSNQWPDKDKINSWIFRGPANISLPGKGLPTTGFSGRQCTHISKYKSLKLGIIYVCTSNIHYTNI